MFYENKLIENVKMEKETLEDMVFVECEFRKCTFENGRIIRCEFIDCQFVDCNIISLRSSYSQIKGIECSHCNLIGVHWSELMPVKRIFDPIRKMSECYLKYNTFMKMNFMKFDFSGNIIQESTFDECNLREINFKGCRLEGTQYVKCDIRKADFRESNGYQIDIAANKLADAKFSFPEVINLLSGLGIKID